MDDDSGCGDVVPTVTFEARGGPVTVGIAVSPEVKLLMLAESYRRMRYGYPGADRAFRDLADRLLLLPPDAGRQG